MTPEHTALWSQSGPSSAGDKAFRKLWHLISRGKMPVGEIETEESLAASLSLSRTPLRDAVRRLENLGLLEREAGKGLKVTPLSMHVMLNLSATREALEGLLAASVAARVAKGEADLTALRAINSRYLQVLKLGDPDLALIVGHDFHEELRRLSQNCFASMCHVEVLLAFERYRYLARAMPSRSNEIAAEHEAILSAIESGNPELAEREMRKHLAAGRAVYTQVLSRMDMSGLANPMSVGDSG